MKATLFIDRDGTLVEEPADLQVDRLDKIRLVPGVMPALNSLRNNGFRFVMVSNQDGLGTDSFPAADFQPVQDFIVGLFASQGIEFDEILICPHRTEDRCHCRKPDTGLVQDYLTDGALDRDNSYVIGDRASDMQLAERMGLRGLRINGELSWAGIQDLLSKPQRQASVRRKTRETDIQCDINLDAIPDIQEIATGIGFFDHMLEQIARHAAFSLKLSCRGDLHIDEHHTVEDTALALGTALRQALGDKDGIERYGFVLPMDEASAQVAIDLGGRSYLVFDGQFTRESVGGLPTELVPHFFRSLADALGAAIHITLRGENNHHLIEAAFKGFGRCLRQACKRTGDGVPSTKGIL